MSKLMNNLLTTGMTVEVMDPKHPDSEHKASFMGKVYQCDQQHVLVRDAENHTYDVFLDEILCVMNYESSVSSYCLRVGENGYDVVCILPTGMVETLATGLDNVTATHVTELLSQPAVKPRIAA
ncbi:hypothetical protein [Porticoccus sp.]